MSKIKAFSCGLLLVLPWLASQAQAATTTGATSSEQIAQVIVKLRRPVVVNADAAASTSLSSDDGSASRQRMQTLGRRASITIDDAHEIGTRMHMARAHGLSSAALAQRLAAQSDVEYAVVDERRQIAAVTPNDPLYATGQASPYPPEGQWYLRASSATLVSALNAPTAWNITQGSSSVVVAVIDTGVRYDHPDLAGKLLPGYNMISDAARAGNSVGRSSDASDLGDWLTQANINANRSLYSGCSVEATSTWHGTQVAGIVGADSNNGVGVASLGWNVKILPVRVLGKCGGYDSDIIAGMRWAAGLSVSGVPANPNPAQVLNLSLGATGTCSQAYTDALTDIVTGQHAVVVVAAGNETGLAVGTPGNCANVIAVAGVRHLGTKVGYSSIGPEVALSAPAGNCVNSSGACLYSIVTTTNTGTTSPVTGSAAYTDASNASLGTSFSAPMVSATVALMLSAQPSLQPAQVAQLLKSTARAFPTTGGTAGIGQCVAPTSATQDECYCTTQTCGAGMLDAGAAVAAAANTAVANITVTPSQPVAGQALTLSAASSRASPGATNVTGYLWELMDGGGIVSALSGSPQNVSIGATPSAAGTFQVRLTVTDDQGQTATSLQSIQVSSAVVANATTTSGTATAQSSGGGGGALDGVTLLMFGAFGWIAVLARRRGQRTRR